MTEELRSIKDQEDLKAYVNHSGDGWIRKKTVMGMPHFCAEVRFVSNGNKKS